MKNEKTVYAIHEGCIYEGGGMASENIYESLEDARTEALKIVAKKQEDLEAMREWELKRGPIYTYGKEKDWREEEENYWRGVHDYVKIITMTFVPDNA